MSKPDVIIRGGTVVTHDAQTVADIAIAEGRIVEIQPAIEDKGRKEINATGLHVFPGLIDSHVHFNDPGRAEWEGIETGSQALAAGGGTMFFDMPLNASPPTIDAASFDSKLVVAGETSVTDFALWGGIVPWNLDHLEALAERGVIGFKAFMSNSGIEDFGCVDDATLKEGMKRAAKLGKLVAVHAESEAITSHLAEEAIAAGKTTVRDYLESRPIHAELDAIHRAIQLAGETKCALHVVHVSSGAGVALVASAQNQGVNVTCETCPHYLVLTEDDVLKLGATAKCAPPLRAKSAQDVLWRYLANGEVSTIGSDHSPAPPEMKLSADFFEVWGGISGVQHTLPLLIAEGHITRKLALSTIARLTSFNVAERFQLPQEKGRIAVGADADFALVDLNKTVKVTKQSLRYRHPHSPYVGRTLTGRMVQTILRGQTIFKGGKMVSTTKGRLVKPRAAN
ncbi:MAG TPA: allantoinase [Verrucomicrobiota bacterium]|nr:allantoinase [Verrucomicrobiota bacterium]